MRAAVVKELGGLPLCVEHDEPQTTGHLVLAEVTASALNPVDLRIASGTWHGASPEPPYVPGSEGVGRLSDGRRVWFSAPDQQGSFAQRCAIDTQRSVDLPDGIDDPLAACLGVAGLAGWLSLRWRAEMKPGETVLVLGASGPVGQFAIQAAKLMGAGRVVAGARNPEGLRRALSLGADAAVNLDEETDLTNALIEATEGGADVTIDPLWGAPAVAAIEAGAHGSRHVQLGQSAGNDATLASSVIRGKGISVLGYSNTEVPLHALLAAYRELAGHALHGRLQIDYDTYPLEQVEQAWMRQGEGAYRKLILIP
jgi:NADPH:quinone reductase-like Zn-dependent oxidoreductase